MFNLDLIVLPAWLWRSRWYRLRTSPDALRRAGQAAEGNPLDDA